MFVGFLYALVSSLQPVFVMFVPRKGSALFVAISIVNFSEGCLEFKTSRKAEAARMIGMIARARVFVRLCEVSPPSNTQMCFLMGSQRGPMDTPSNCSYT